MGHYDECRSGYCAACGAAPGNIKNGVCEFCTRAQKSQSPLTTTPITMTPDATEQLSYVFENTEVVKTGRRASRPLKSGKVDILVEITPKETMNGTWKKWVNEGTLFSVQ